MKKRIRTLKRKTAASKGGYDWERGGAIEIHILSRK